MQLRWCLGYLYLPIPVRDRQPQLARLKGVEIDHVECAICSGDADNAIPLKDSNCFDDATSVFTADKFLDSGDAWKCRLAFSITMDQQCHVDRGAELGECCQISTLDIFVINKESARLILFAEFGPIYLGMQLIEVCLLLVVVEIFSCF